MLRELSPELANIAKDELNEKPNQIQDDLRNLKEWISKQPHLIARTDDQWLIAILRGCKFSLEKCKKKLDLYYTLRTTAPDVTLRLKPTEQKFIDFMRYGTCLILPKSEKLAPRVVLLRVAAYDPHLNNVADMMCLLYFMVQILVMEDDTATVLGTKIVVDYEGISTNHLAQASPGLLKKLIAVSQDSMPLRLKGSHHINVPSSVEVFFKMIKTLLNEKGRQRFNIHKNYDELMAYIPKEILPKEYGGNGGAIHDLIEHWVQQVVKYKTWMTEEEKLGTDESKRLGSPKSAEEMFGIQGSFRKLDID